MKSEEKSTASCDTGSPPKGGKAGHNPEWHREGTYNYYLRRMKEDNALDKQVGGQHYKDCAIQPVEYIFQNNLDYFEGNVVKYITRHRKKGGGKKDIEKAIHYAQLILELHYSE